MFTFKIATLLAVASLVFAMPAPQAGSCSTGPVQCCDSIQPAKSSSNADLLGSIPIDLQNSEVPIGVNCNPIGVFGLGTAGTCSGQTACCSGVSNKGTLPIGMQCSPINMNL